jgi:hypothetical protein
VGFSSVIGWHLIGPAATRATLPPAPLTQRETIEDLLAQSGRGIVPVRKNFVQQGRGKDDWYGISPDSADRGLRELRKATLLHTDRQWVKNQRSDTGWTEHWTYTLTGPFSSSARRDAAAAGTNRKPKRDSGETT